MLSFVPLAGTPVGSYGLDESVFRALNLAGTNPVLDVIMSFFSAIALPYILPLLALPLWWKGRRELAFDLLVLLLLVLAITEAMKYVFDRARPCEPGVLSNVNLLTPGACAAEGDPAFPSGHTSRIFAVATILSLTFKRDVRLGSFAVAILTGVSRVYLGVHWPSDVFAGAVLGVALAAALFAFAHRVRFYQEVRSRVIGAVSGILHRGARA